MSAIKTTGTSGTRAFPLFGHVKYEHLIAGLSGGVVSTLMLHPLDLIKIRFAVNDGVTHSAPQYSGLRGAVREIRRTEGLKGLYRGVVPNILGSGSSWGFYSFFYNTIKTWFQGGNAKKPVGPVMHMVAAADAGILTLLITNLIRVVKTRLCPQYKSDVKLVESRRYALIDALSKIYRTEGIRGLYKGLAPGMFRVSHGALRFMTYEEMKTSYNDYRGVSIDTKLVRYILERPIDTTGTRREDDGLESERMNRKRLQSDKSVDSEDSYCIVFETGSNSDYGTDYDYTTTDDEDEYEESDDDDSGQILKVRFSPRPVIHTMVTWNYAYRAARRGPWEEMARDRERFEYRINCIARVLDPVLVPQHRSEIWQRRFAVQI